MSKPDFNNLEYKILSFEENRAMASKNGTLFLQIKETQDNIVQQSYILIFADLNRYFSFCSVTLCVG
jgi:hypothetical protein